MARRTYIPNLYTVLNITNRYAKRYQTKLEAGLTTQQYNCLVAVINAINECLIALGPQNVNP